MLRVSVLAVLVLLTAGLPLSAQSSQVSRSPRELGQVVLRDLWIRDGKLVFRVDSNGCTDPSSFQVQIAKEESLIPKAAHYRLTIRRVRVDDCKAMLWEGVVVELNLEGDLGLKGTYTVSVTNPVAANGQTGP